MSEIAADPSGAAELLLDVSGPSFVLTMAIKGKPITNSNLHSRIDSDTVLIRDFYLSSLAPLAGPNKVGAHRPNRPQNRVLLKVPAMIAWIHEPSVDGLAAVQGPESIRWNQ